MTTAQPGILADVPTRARYLTFDLLPDADADETRVLLSELGIDAHIVVGLGASTLHLLGGKVDGLRPFAAKTAGAVDVPSTPAALWVWLRGGDDEDRGDLVHRSRYVEMMLAPSFVVRASVDAFKHKEGHDLTGYEDGTENPTGDDARRVAHVDNGGPLSQGSFVSVQQWVHDLALFETFDDVEQDHIMGRRRSDNEELDDAPPSAHVKRTAQEDFTPEAFVVRRSMPWASDDGEGLLFVAFAHTLDPFEAQLRRMCGEDDGIVDGLFKFTRPITGAHFFCPAVVDGRLALDALGAP